MIRLVFDDIKLIAKQNGYELGFRWLNGKRKMTKYQKESYIDFKQAIGLLARVQCNRQGWKCTSGMVRVCSYLFWPRRLKAPDVADNGFSGVYDALEGVVYDNDRQIKRVGAIEHIETDKMKRIELTIEPFEYLEIRKVKGKLTSTRRT